MMELSFFLAKVFGLYLVIVSVTLLFRGESFKARVRDMVSNQGVMLLTSIITLIMGILLVVSHSLWVMDWRVIITLLCWLVFLKGIARLWLPDMDQQALKCIENKPVYMILVLFFLAIGVFCIYMGFYS